MRPARLLLAACLAATFGCPKSVPEVELSAPVDAGVDPLVARLDALEAEVGAVLRAQDEALWKHWTTGAPLDLSKATAGHDALFTRATLLELRQAHERLPPTAARRALHLERWLTGQLLSRALATENEAVASLEAGLTFVVDGKDVAWRELPRLLLTEKSAVKRRGLWKASLAAAERLDAALARRDAKANEVAASLDSPSMLELAAEARELDLDELARAAEVVLASSDATWRAALQRQSDEDVRLPLASLTRAELPRLLRVPAAVDAAFPRDQLAPRAVQLLGTLGVYGRPGLTLDLSGGAKKHPLPLTVAPSPREVRVSFRPVGGLRDQAALLSELGAALALSEAHTGSLATERLGDPATAQALADLFSGLLGDDAWLSSVGVTGAAQRAVADAWATHHLFTLRRAAGVVLVRLETQGLSEADARVRFVQIMSRALGLPPAAEDGVRWRIDTDDFLRAATQLKAAALAERTRARVPADWFTSKDGWNAVAALWAAGTSEPLAVRLGATGRDGQALGARAGGAGLTAVASGDGGLHPGPWGAPAQAAVDGGVRAASQGVSDGGLSPGPWGAPAQAAVDGGVRAASASQSVGDGGLKPGPRGAPAQAALGVGVATSLVTDGGAQPATPAQLGLDGGARTASPVDGGLTPGPWGTPAQAALGVGAAAALATDGGPRPGTPGPLGPDGGARVDSTSAPLTGPGDGGLHPGPWGAPQQAVLDGGARVGATSAPLTGLGDGGLHPGPWGAPAQAAVGVGAAASRHADGGPLPSTPPQVALDGGARVDATSAPLTGLGDGGLHPGPWGAPAQAAVGAGAASSRLADGGPLPVTPQRASPDGGARAASTSAIAGDGGLRPGPWGTPQQAALDGGARASTSASASDAGHRAGSPVQATDAGTPATPASGAGAGGAGARPVDAGPGSLPDGGVRTARPKAAPASPTSADGGLHPRL